MRVAEEYADGNATPSELDDAFWAADRSLNMDCGQPFRNLACKEREDVADVWDLVVNNLYAVEDPLHDATAEQLKEWEGLGIREYRAQADLLRDVFNPFRPADLNPTLRTAGIVAIAQAAYDHRSLPSGHLELDRLGVLADALEEAGCESADILNHLRQPGQRVRGCWAVDLVLAKEQPRGRTTKQGGGRGSVGGRRRSPTTPPRKPPDGD